MSSDPIFQPSSRCKSSNPYHSGATSSVTSSSGSRQATPERAHHIMIMLDPKVPLDTVRVESMKASRRRMKRCIFDHSLRVDWKSIPTFDDTDDEVFDHAILSRRPDLWCDASRKYRDHVINQYREPVVDFKFDVKGNQDGDENFVDMIG